MTDQHERRFDDRDRLLNDRLDAMEHDHQQLRHQVTAIDARINIVQLEQTHLKDLFDARLKVIERTMEMQLTEIKSIGLNISKMGDSPDGTPMGRTMLTEVHQVRATCDEHHDTLTSLKDWQTRVDGVLVILKWIGAGGLVALGITLLRLLRMLP